ncbi:hypothetical protein [Streptomyces sp. NPDC059009]|uniref:hypothetical protein n=1 Tax=Streptomyces sp. NPDC059009 TaxID=3346694 RepID=UPI0036BEACDE
MDENAEQQPPVASSGYALDQLSRAFVTALTHEDASTRHRAEDRTKRWRAVLAGMAEGKLTIGSRAPVADLPSWVTPEVVRGGFVTGTAGAEGPLEPYEVRAAQEFGVPATRHALFAYCLTEPGLAWLCALLDSGRYRVDLPEEASLLTLAWLVRRGELEQAVHLVDVLEPFADRLRFLPRPARHAAPDVAAVHRRTVAETGKTLARRRPNTAVETQREALAVWQPFADELLVLWLEFTAEGRDLTDAPDPAWLRRAAALLTRYRELAARHTLCTKHRSPKENLGILRGALEEVVAGRPLDARRAGMLRHAITSMVRKRGLPDSAQHTALRHAQARQAALPSHHALAQLVLRRLAGLPQEVGAADVAPLVAPVGVHEQEETGLPSGAQIPPAIRKVVEAALSAPLGTLVERGVVPSAEVLAELIPQLVAVTTAQTYRDEPLRRLMAANYRAFRNRRSLLLLNLERQVRVDELPWARAVTAHADTGAGQEPAAEALRQLGELAVQGFPGTILPNPLIRELGVLARQADLGAPLVEELAADIFMGTFSPKFLAAARVAAELLAGSLYERYYGIDYKAVRNLAISESAAALNRSYGARTTPGFAKLCAERAGGGDLWSVAAGGKVIEQAQILTTHNLATLVARVGIAPQPGWEDLARRCFGTVCRLTARVHHNPRPLATIKDAAYAWRQLLFHLSLCDADAQARVLTWLDEEAARHPAHVAARLAPALTGLRLIASGRSFDADGTAERGAARRLLGWSTDGHWLRPDPTDDATRRRVSSITEP